MNGQQENEAHADFVIFSVVCAACSSTYRVLYLHLLIITDLELVSSLGKGCTVVVPRWALRTSLQKHTGSVHPHSCVEDPHSWTNSPGLFIGLNRAQTKRSLKTVRRQYKFSDPI